MQNDAKSSLEPLALRAKNTN